MVLPGNDSVLEINNGINDESENIGMPREHKQLAYALIASIGIVGNALAIFVIAQSSKMRNKFTNILILNQSSIDMATSVCILVIKMINFSNENLSGLGGELYCRLWWTEILLWSLMISSSYTLMVLTLERYLRVVHPFFHHKFVSKKKILAFGGAAWWPGPILMLCFIVPTSGIIDGHCVYNAKLDNETWKKARGVVLIIMQYLLPITVFITCYIRMLMRLRTKVQPLAPSSDNEAACQKARARRNLLTTLFAVIVGYLLCNSFNQLTYLAYAFGAPLDFSSYYYNFTVIAMFSNCCINPFVYALRYEVYQKELRKLFCKRPVRESTSASLNTAVEMT
ncbi:Somatostatin receptor type 5 [Lamellibrachia satsuma]|nr:Somatostatin receptor type 5 [Lamellibrachia satsuma]